MSVASSALTGGRMSGSGESSFGQPGGGASTGRCRGRPVDASAFPVANYVTYLVVNYVMYHVC